MRLKSRNTWASGQTGCRLHAWSILQGGKTPLFFYKMAFSYIFDPLLAVITTHHTVNLHFSPLPACPPVTCMCRLCLCVCVCIYAHIAGRRGGAVILDLAEAAQFV